MSTEYIRREVLATLALGMFAEALPTSVAKAASDPIWRKLPTDPYKGKQDDICFASRDVGWYGNGKGRVYGTRNGGDTWTLLWEKPGTYVRALGFVDENIGILGNIGIDDFPGVTDTNPIYRTTDGGRTFTAVTNIDGPVPKGICAIDILRHPFVNAGVLGTRVTLRAGGRVGGPAMLMTSHDLGISWKSQDLSPLTGAILDIRFLDERTGFIAGASDQDVDRSNAVVLMTVDGGVTWRRVYQSARPFEITWKLSFPSPRVGYVTVQNYDEDVTVAKRVIAKTTDGGRTWREMPVAIDHKLREFGVGFLDERRGWIGGSTGGYETTDGGMSWRRVDMGLAVNKIRIVHQAGTTRVFAIGLDVRRLDLPV